MMMLMMSMMMMMSKMIHGDGSPSPSLVNIAVVWVSPRWFIFIIDKKHVFSFFIIDIII